MQEETGAGGGGGGLRKFGWPQDKHSVGSLGQQHTREGKHDYAKSKVNLKCSCRSYG